jgi:hypothetical protein
MISGIEVWLENPPASKDLNKQFDGGLMIDVNLSGLNNKTYPAPASDTYIMFIFR